jgi:SAM-dependent methyltransferase
MSAKSSSPGRLQLAESAARPTAGESLAARLPSLVEAWRKERKLPATGGLDKREIEAAGKSLLALQRGLTGDRRLAGAGYMEDRELLGAYLLYYWPVSYLEVSLALATLPLASASFVPRRVLDLGSGPGPAAAAVVDALKAGGEADLEELMLVDASRKALDLAESILARGSPSLRVSTTVLDLETDPELPEGSFDLIVMGHCLNELWRGASDAIDRRLDLVRRAARRLAPGGRILLVEPAPLVTCRELIALRDRLAEGGWRVLGPCPGSYPCPALAAGPDRSCHAESRWAPPEPAASLAKAAGLDRTSVKWAYFFLTPEASSQESRPAEDEARLVGSRRVVSDPMLNKAGRLRYILCGEGRLETVSARADDEAAAASGFIGLRRGDILRATGLEDRPGGGFGFGPRSSLELCSRAPEISP